MFKMLLTASLIGIKNKYKLPKAEDLDGMENVRATKHVPSSLSKALENFLMLLLLLNKLE